MVLTWILIFIIAAGLPMLFRFEMDCRVQPETKRPWGIYKVLLQGPGYKVKEILVNPYSSLSYQSHNYRSEHWVVVQGCAKVTIENQIQILQQGGSTYVPAKTKHRLENCTTQPLKIIEIQLGEYLEENDIIRYDDLYGRK